jgi:predicted nucleic acid-binding protein
MAIVLDASIVAVWALADESSPLAIQAATRLKSEAGFVPRIWWYEIRNLLLVNERRQRISPNDSLAFLTLLSSFPIQFDQLFEEEPIFRLARQFRLSFYDAAYLELAQRHGIPLATLDKALQAAAISAGISLLV